MTQVVINTIENNIKANVLNNKKVSARRIPRTKQKCGKANKLGGFGKLRMLDKVSKPPLFNQGEKLIEIIKTLNRHDVSK